MQHHWGRPLCLLHALLSDTLGLFDMHGFFNLSGHGGRPVFNRSITFMPNTRGTIFVDSKRGSPWKWFPTVLISENGFSSGRAKYGPSRNICITIFATTPCINGTLRVTDTLVESGVKVYRTLRVDSATSVQSGFLLDLI